MKRTSYLIIIILIMAPLLSCSPKRDNPAPEEDDKPVPVRVMEVKNQDLPLVVESVGRLGPNREVTLSAEVGGVVESYSAGTGDRAEEGQILVRIDPTDYQLALKEAEANLEVARARLDASEKTFERSKSLLPRNVITTDAFEKYEADFKSSRASVARVKVLVDIAKERLNKTRISAPFAGLIASRTVEKGMIIGTRQPLMTLVDLDTVRVRVYLRDRGQ
ncbi:efflux RND transporter periplasmic adaptor subunit [Thermodesulfobacteriota bacterium]